MNETHMAVEVENLVRDYQGTGQKSGSAPHGVRALNGVTFSVAEGTLFGILGPNGAGKTTMVKVLSTVITPTAGSARVFGHDVAREPQRVRPRIGVAYGGDLGLYWRLNGLDNLVFAGQLQGMPARESVARAWELLEQFGLSEAARKRVDGWSRGMRQRLHLARCLIHQPDLIFLDEPTNGLDPAAARNLRLLIENLRRTGKTIFLTTHNMSEADSLCDQLAIISKGKLVALGAPAEIKRSFDAFRLLEIKVSPETPVDQDLLRRRLGLTGEPSPLTCEQTDSATVIRLRYKGAAPVHPLLEALGAAPVLDIATRDNSLEEAYLRLVEERGA